MADLKNVNEQEFLAEISKKDTSTLAYFWATWCNPCKTMGPIFEEFASQSTNMNFIKIDVDAVQSVAQQYNVMSIPTFFLFKDGQVVAQNVGSMTMDQLKEFANK